MVLLIIQFADVFTLVPGLIKHGLSNIEAMEAKGVFDRGQPLIQLGTVLGSSFALALIPTISKQRLVEDPAKFRGYIEGVFLFSFYLAAGAVIGLVMIVPETNTLLFQNTKGTMSLRRSEEHTSELQSRGHLVCRLLLEKKKHYLKATGQ